MAKPMHQNILIKSPNSVFNFMLLGFISSNIILYEVENPVNLSNLCSYIYFEAV